jgi:phage-related minor tail protein
MYLTPEEIKYAHDAGMATLTQKIDKGGLTEEYLIKKLKALTNVKDERIRLSAVIEAFKLRGAYPDKAHRLQLDGPIQAQLEVVFVSGANSKKTG